MGLIAALRMWVSIMINIRILVSRDASYLALHRGEQRNRKLVANFFTYFFLTSYCEFWATAYFFLWTRHEDATPKEILKAIGHLVLSLYSAGCHRDLENLKKIWHLSGVGIVKTRVKIELSNDISSMSGSLKFIFYGSRVLMSTTKLQSISFIGPLVFKIEHSNVLITRLYFWNQLQWYIVQYMYIEPLLGFNNGKSRVLYLEHQ